jgi:hypothetical protein
MKTNWKTTACGVCAILVALATGLSAIIDNDPKTNIDIGATVAAITAGIGLIFAKDASKADA